MRVLVPDTLGPEVLVESGVDSDIGGAHLLLGELLHFLDGAGSAVLEPDPVEALVQIDGVLAGHHLAHGRALLLTFGSHSRGLKNT